MNIKNHNVMKLMKLGYQFKIKNGNYIVLYTKQEHRLTIRKPLKSFIVAQGSTNESVPRKARKEATRLAIAAAWAHNVRTR